MEKEVIPTEEQWLEWIDEQVVHLDSDDDISREMMVEWHKKHFPIERYQEIVNQRRTQITGLLLDWISSDEDKMNEILDGLDDTIADCLIDISNHVSELETNLEEFQYLADDIPSVWAI